MRRSDLHCQIMDRHDGGTFYSHFMRVAQVSQLHDTSKPVYAIVVEECEEAPDCYWAWWDNKDQEFHHVYYAKGLVNMCFAYGSEPEEKRGHGHLLPVKVTLGNLVLEGRKR